MIQRYKAVIKYDGTNFSGFQIQEPRLRTIQGVIEKALFKMTKGQKITVFGSGRTDAGVHAFGQVIHFDYPGKIAANSMKAALNSLMPLEIEFLEVNEVDQDFHARFSVHSKTYFYRVDRGRFVDPFKRLYAAHYPYKLDVSRIVEAAKDIEGTHDFIGFAASGNQTKNSIRTIYEVNVIDKAEENELEFIFKGNGFLYNQVRIMVGVLLEIGNGRRPVHDFERLFVLKDRQQARWTAPANGLYLKEVSY